MLCVVALIVFGVLGIFSAKYRVLAKEAFNCVFKRITFRPCESNFDRKIKMKFFLKLKKIPILARTWYKHYELVSWGFVILFIGSSFFAVRGVYNLVTYGSCDPHSTNCIFNPGVLTCESEECIKNGCDCEAIGCEYPLYEACEGNCTCIGGTCG